MNRHFKFYSPCGRDDEFASHDDGGDGGGALACDTHDVHDRVPIRVTLRLSDQTRASRPGKVCHP